MKAVHACFYFSRECSRKIMPDLKRFKHFGKIIETYFFLNLNFTIFQNISLEFFNFRMSNFVEVLYFKVLLESSVNIYLKQHLFKTIWQKICQICGILCLRNSMCFRKQSINFQNKSFKFFGKR